MNVDDLWIGDVVQIASTKEKGTFEGKTADGKIKVKTEQAIRLVAAEDLMPVSNSDSDAKYFWEELVEQEHTLEELPKEEKFDLESSLEFNRTLDLHIEKLNSKNIPKELTDLDFQKQQCKAYLKEAVRLRVPRVVIIHGVGKGVLKETVEDLLFDFIEVIKVNSINDGGALEAWLEYE